MSKELCIRCGKEIEYDTNTPITISRYFVEGSGQLCSLCFQKLYTVPTAYASYSGSDLEERVHEKEEVLAAD